eukprot:scaffold454_cov124-Isochrysis_galbana.AAC.2
MRASCFSNLDKLYVHTILRAQYIFQYSHAGRASPSHIAVLLFTHIHRRCTLRSRSSIKLQYAKDYMMLYPQGIDVPSEKDGDPAIHFDVSARHASKPNPAKRRVAANVLARIAITDYCQDLAQFITPADLAAGWASLGFDPINPRWGQNKITNQDGDTALGGRNSVIWIDLPSVP